MILNTFARYAASLPDAELPIVAITNGIHTRSWLAPEMTQLYDRYLGIQWESRPTDYAIWKRADHIPDAELWRTHERRLWSARGLA